MREHLVQRLATEVRGALQGAVVRRVVRLVDGVAVVLSDGGAEHEVGVVLPGGAAWAWWLAPGARAAVLPALATADPDLVGGPCAGWRDPKVTPADALRAWLFRPAPGAGPWVQLEGARLTDAIARPRDRVLELWCERRDAVGTPQQLRVVAELFDQGGNVYVQDANGGVIASWRDRPPARARTPRPEGEAEPAATLPLAALAHLALAANAAHELQRLRARDARRDVAHLERLLEKLSSEGDDAGEAERHRQEGELLTANLHRIKRGQVRVTVEDWFTGGAERTIELDPQRSPQDNVARVFKRARRAARGHDTIAARRAETAVKLAAARTELMALEAASTWASALAANAGAFHQLCPRAAATPAPALWTPGGPPWSARPTERSEPARSDGPGRRYVLPGGWEARVGRSNKDNDELTHRFAHADDVWLHASGVPGSHVVLRMQGRAGNPPKDILEMAAALAARFSRAKHAGTVPVIWTRKRYVRKPRGAAAGLAACTQEKTVFVKPALPPGAPDTEDDSPE